MEGWLAKTSSRYSLPRVLLLVSKKRALTAAWKLQLCMRQREVVADPWDVVLGRGLFEERVGAGAVGALKVLKLDDGDAGAGRRLEGGRVVDLRGIGRAKLGVGRDGDHGGEGNGK